MAIPNTNTITVTDTLPGEEVAATIGDPAFVMQALSDLYSDVITAFIREYSTNAYDAELDLAEATGADPKPITVTLPNALNPVFTVTDAGIGMSTETMREHYLSYGDSNKRKKKNSNGQLGFGCKSAVAYTPAFTVTSVFNGVETTAIVRRKPDWSISMNLVTNRTDKANGTTVQIPVNHADIDEVRAKAHDFFTFWLPGRVLVDGKEVEHNVGEKIADNLYRSTKYATSYVVMTNVAYPITNAQALFYGTGMNPINFVAYVDSSDVDFNKSREQLAYTDKTKAVLKNIIVDFTTKIVKQAQDEIDNSADHGEAYLNWVKWCDLLGEGMFKNLNFNGDDFVNTFPIKGKRWKTRNSYGRGDQVRSISDWQIRWVQDTLFVVDFGIEMSSNVKKKMAAWAKHKDITLPNNVVFTPQEKLESVWIPSDKVVTWATIKAETPKPKKDAVGFGRIAGSWDYWDGQSYKQQGEIPENREVFYVTFRQRDNFSLYNVIASFKPDAVVVLVPLNRLEKFQRDYPKVLNFINWCIQQVDTDAVKVLSDDAKELLSVKDSTIQWLRYLDVEKLSDPRWKRVKSLESRRAELLREYNAVIAKAAKVGVGTQRFSETKIDLVAEYSLLSVIDKWRMSRYDEDLHVYMNAAFAARKEN